MAQRQKVRRTLGTLEDYQSLVVPVFGHFNLLLLEMALVEPMFSETFLLHFRQRGAGITIARHAIMIGMLDQCIIHACTLLEGKGGLQNGIKLRPSLRTLLHPFTSPSGYRAVCRRSSPLLHCFSVLHISRMPNTPKPQRTHPPSKSDDPFQLRRKLQGRSAAEWQSGHDSFDTMWRHYHRATTEAEAKKFGALGSAKRKPSIMPIKQAI